MKNRRWILTIGLLCCAYGQVPGNATDKDHAQKTTQEHKESVEQQTSTAQEGKVDKKENITLLSSMLYSGVLGLGLISFDFVFGNRYECSLEYLGRRIALSILGALAYALTKFSFFDKCFDKRCIRNVFALAFHLGLSLIFALIMKRHHIDHNQPESDSNYVIRRYISCEVLILLVMFLLLEGSRMLILHKKEDVSKRPLLHRLTYGFMVVGSEFVAIFFVLLCKPVFINFYCPDSESIQIDHPGFLKNYWMLLLVGIILVFLLPYITDLLRSKLPQKWKPYSGQLLFLLSYECFRIIIFLMFAPPLRAYFFSLGVRSMYLSIIVGARLFSKMREELLTKKKKDEEALTKSNVHVGKMKPEMKAKS